MRLYHKRNDSNTHHYLFKLYLLQFRKQCKAALATWRETMHEAIYEASLTHDHRLSNNRHMKLRNACFEFQSRRKNGNLARTHRFTIKGETWTSSAWDNLCVYERKWSILAIVACIKLGTCIKNCWLLYDARTRWGMHGPAAWHTHTQL